MVKRLSVSDHFAGLALQGLIIVTGFYIHRQKAFLTEAGELFERFDHFVGLALQGLINVTVFYFHRQKSFLTEHFHLISRVVNFIFGSKTVIICTEIFRSSAKVIA